jgi:hypothetical protein
MSSVTLFFMNVSINTKSCLGRIVSVISSAQLMETHFGSIVQHSI